MIFDILCVVAIATLFAIGAEAWTKMLLNVEALREMSAYSSKMRKTEVQDVEMEDVCMKKFPKEVTKKNDKRKRK